MGMAKEKILVVEDEEDIMNLVEYNLHQGGFQVIRAIDGEKALIVAREEHPDLIILDLMLPGIEGTEVCKILKQDNATRQIPIIILSAKGEEMDRIIGLELGAADYVTKPFSPRELVLRVKAVLQRDLPQDESGDLIQIGDLAINIAEHQVWVKGKLIVLTYTEFKLLAYLVKNRGRVQDRETLLNEVWGYDSLVYGRTVDTHTRRLRVKLGSLGDSIETIRGIGYRFKE
jgi:two-component system phosphate regulon response regulator PhoB